MSQSATEANDKIAALTEEVGRLKAQRLLDNEDLARAYDMGRDKERAAVVAWLHRPGPLDERGPEEVERLRAEVSYLRACVPPTRPTDYGHEVWTAALRAEVAAERAAVVAWLRTTQPTRMWAALLDASDAIERGEHRQTEKE